MTTSEAITELSDMRAEYNCFDADEEPKYKALSMAIEALSTLDEIENIANQPQIYEDVLKYKMICKYFEMEKGGYIADDDGANSWMPLPKPYTEEEQ